MEQSEAPKKSGGESGTFVLVSWLFLRALGLIYFSAFVSFGVQAMGLIGSHGIVPLAQLVDAMNAHDIVGRYWSMPMLFWLNSSDIFIQIVCWGGAALSLLVVADIFPTVCLFLLYALYLSLIYGGQTFMTFQWDFLLVDAGFLGFLLSLSARPGILLLRWLVFRFMFLSGVVKIMSGDSTWRDFTALDYHFLTQPLPTPLAWYAHHFSPNMLATMTATTLFIELFLPFLVLLPWRRVRFAGAFGILALQIVIALTGNYNFFNLLVIACCFAVFDDAAFLRVLPKKASDFIRVQARVNAPHIITANAVGAVGLLIMIISCSQLGIIFAEIFYGPPPQVLSLVSDAIAPLRIVNTYGPFAVMTRKREEIVIEGSNDGTHWKEYGFAYKPGDVMRRPLWNIPHQPRLDWQLWFAALDTPVHNPWFVQFLQRLLEGEPEVTGLLETNPFPDHPPRYVRAMFYDYRFTTPAEKARTGAWWVRRQVGAYFPEVKLK